MATQKAPATTVVVPAGSSTSDIFKALADKAKAVATQRVKAPGSLASPTEIGPGVVATMQGTTLILAIETGDEARGAAEKTDKGGTILAKAGNFGRTIPLPGTDMGLSLYLGIAPPKAAK